MRIPLGMLVAVVFLILWRIRTFIYNFKKRRRLKTRVLSVGNLTMGGTGKTPMVDYLIRLFQSHNPEIKLGVLSRGYKSETNQPMRVGESSTFAGDEIEWLKQKHPAVEMSVFKKRFEAGRLLEAQGQFDLFILDDGFQHWELHRDMDIVLVDATQGAEALGLFPLGQGREPLMALQRAGLIVLTKCNWAKPHVLSHLKTVLPLYAPAVPLFEFAAQIQLPQSTGSDKRPVVLVSGIARPQIFEQSVTSQAIDVQYHFSFSDHHNYTEADVKKIMQYCHNHSLTEVWTTEKDEVKLKKLWNPSEGIELKSVQLNFYPIHNEESFYAKISQVLA